MSSVQDCVRGRFISAVQELIATPVQPHQITAANHPKVPTKALVTRREAPRPTLERHANERLSPRPN